GRLAPALVSPVRGGICEHAAEVGLNAAINAAGGWEGGAGVGVGPGATAVGGPVNLVGVVVWEAATAFIHPGDVHVARDFVAGDLDVADKGGGDLVRGPRVPVVSGNPDEEGASANIKVVPGDI